MLGLAAKDWMLVAFVLFSLGGVFSVFEGVEKLTHPHSIESAGWAIGVLLVSMVLEGLSFRTGLQEARKLKPPEWSWPDFIHRSKNPEVTVVLLETFPAASFASTASVCDVLHVRPENVAESDVVVPAAVPSR